MGADCRPGECLALSGPSGAGKSSVLRIVAGLLRPRRGVVSCAAETWLDTETGVNVAPEGRRCGYVFQDYAIFEHLTAWQNVAFGMRGTPRRARRRRAEALLDRFGLLARADARPVTMSGGERQRVAVARALAREPAALLLDEPLSALDARTRASAGRELAGVLRDTRAPTILVTHDFAEAAVLGDRVAVVDEGRVVQVGTAAELAAAPASAFVADFTGAVVLTGVARGRDEGVTIVDLDGGGQVVSTDVAEGPVAASVYPWEIVIEPAEAAATGSARNRLAAEVVSITPVGGRVRLGLAATQPLAAEISEAAVHEMDLRPGARVTATWKATATRLVRA
ncbi:MAG TPA: TOBE-like domain-containing protein [Thermoleophilaceae bacterium]|jgi:molybdate transport system ATP-binding protein